ncbi:MAG: hypothetical protein P8Z42_00395 [Anaerolineales bacterium]
MQRAEDARVEEFGIEARGYPHVADAEVGGEGMHRFILPSTIEIEPEGFDDFHSEVPLVFLVEGLMNRRVIDSIAHFVDGVNQFDLFRP